MSPVYFTKSSSCDLASMTHVRRPVSGDIAQANRLPANTFRPSSLVSQADGPANAFAARASPLLPGEAEISGAPCGAPPLKSASTSAALPVATQQILA